MTPRDKADAAASAEPPKPPREGAAHRAREGASKRELSTAGELVERGGLAGGLTLLLYIVVGGAFWSLVGWGADHLLGTRWLVIAGAGLGAGAGIYLGYLHMREGLKPSSPHQQHPPRTSSSGSDAAPRA